MGSDHAAPGLSWTTGNGERVAGPVSVDSANHDTAVGRVDGQRVGPTIDGGNVLRDFDGLRIDDAKVTVPASDDDARSVAQPSEILRCRLEPGVTNHTTDGRLPDPNTSIASGRSEHRETFVRRTQRESVNRPGVLVQAAIELTRLRVQDS